MGKSIYKKKEHPTIRGICVKCGEDKQTSIGKRDGVTIYRPICGSCHRSRGIKYKYRSHKGKVCSRCGFVPEHMCQLDVDHIDGDHNNNDLSNLQTLCANCHRLKSRINNDNINEKYKDKSA